MMKASCKLDDAFFAGHRTNHVDSACAGFGSPGLSEREENMTEFTTTRRVAVGLVAAASATFATGAYAGGHGIDLSGKNVEWVIPFSETGGSAKWANFYAPLLSEALPGEPTVVVKFMPGSAIAVDQMVCTRIRSDSSI